jgi:hypothetical protein
MDRVLSTPYLEEVLGGRGSRYEGRCMNVWDGLEE